MLLVLLDLGLNATPVQKSSLWFQAKRADVALQLWEERIQLDQLGPWSDSSWDSRLSTRLPDYLAIGHWKSPAVPMGPGISWGKIGVEIVHRESLVRPWHGAEFLGQVENQSNSDTFEFVRKWAVGSSHKIAIEWGTSWLTSGVCGFCGPTFPNKIILVPNSDRFWWSLPVAKMLKRRTAKNHVVFWGNDGTWVMRWQITFWCCLSIVTV